MVSNLVIKIFIFGGNYFVGGELVLYINHSGKYIEINFNMKIPFSDNLSAFLSVNYHYQLLISFITW